MDTFFSNQERRLKRVGNVIGVAQGTTADPQDHRPMAGHQTGERGLGRIPIGPGPEPIEQLRVGQAIACPDVEERMDVAENRR
jgi:hypothetical protein